MQTEDQMKIRRAINGLSIGSNTLIMIKGLTVSEIQAEAEKFSKSKKLPCVFEQSAAGLVATRVAEAVKRNAYGEIDLLAIGESKLFDIPPSLHSNLRTGAWKRSQSGKVLYSCAREGDGMRVTRLPATPAESEACGPMLTTVRTTAYDLERLATVRQLRLTVPRPEQDKLRMAVHRKGVKTGWTIRARLQDDGSMLVYRTDAGAQPSE